MLCWNTALWLAFASHVNSFIQLEFFDSEWHSYSTLKKLWHRLRVQIFFTLWWDSSSSSLSWWRYTNISFNQISYWNFILEIRSSETHPKFNPPKIENLILTWTSSDTLSQFLSYFCPFQCDQKLARLFFVLRSVTRWIIRSFTAMKICPIA